MSVNSYKSVPPSPSLLFSPVSFFDADGPGDGNVLGKTTTGASEAFGRKLNTLSNDFFALTLSSSTAAEVLALFTSASRVRALRTNSYGIAIDFGGGEERKSFFAKPSLNSSASLPSFQTSSSSFSFSFSFSKASPSPPFPLPPKRNASQS